MRMIVDEFRAGTIVSTMKLASRLLFLSIGEAGFRNVLADYGRVAFPQQFGSSEADAFHSYLQTHSVPVPHLLEVVAFERAADRVLLTGESQTVHFHCDPARLLGGLVDGRIDTDMPDEAYEVHLSLFHGSLDLDVSRVRC